MRPDLASEICLHRLPRAIARECHNGENACRRESFVIRLIVFYNLQPGSDEAEFLRRRQNERRDPVASVSGVQRADFGLVTESPLPGQGRTPNDLPWRFMTVAEWDTRAAFESSFYDEGLQAQFSEIHSKASDVLFLVSEVLTGTDRRKEAS